MSKAKKEELEKPLIKNPEDEVISEYMEKLKRDGYEAELQNNIITVYVTELTENIVAIINELMQGYPKSYRMLPLSRQYSVELKG